MTANILKIETNTLPSDKPILVPDDIYSVIYMRHVTWLFKGRYPKVVITFSIQDFGEFYLREINAYYNVRRIVGKPSKNGHFVLGWKSNLMLDISNIFGPQPRMDRISMCRFNKKLIKVQTKTVKYNRDQREYPENMHYSVVCKMLEATEI